MIGGLLLALTSAALINIGFLLQHRGLRRTGGGGILGQLWRALHDPVWLSGQALGWAGFIAQVVAVAVAPLSLVQAFAAGGLALSVPVAAWMFRKDSTEMHAATERVYLPPDLLAAHNGVISAAADPRSWHLYVKAQLGLSV